MAKLVFNNTEVDDAPRGGLASYGFTLMVIHYLQYAGVVPVLQQVSKI